MGVCVRCTPPSPFASLTGLPPDSRGKRGKGGSVDREPPSFPLHIGGRMESMQSPLQTNAGAGWRVHVSARVECCDSVNWYKSALPKSRVLCQKARIWQVSCSIMVPACFRGLFWGRGQMLDHPRAMRVNGGKVMKKLTLLAVAAVVAPLANAAIIYDTLTQAYDSGNGNCLGGDSLFGSKYDLQLADDFTIGSATTITAVTVRNLTFTGANPGSAVLRIMN